MADNPIGGAGGFAGEAAKAEAGAAVEKVSSDAGSSAQQGKGEHDAQTNTASASSSSVEHSGGAAGGILPGDSAQGGSVQGGSVAADLPAVAPALGAGGTSAAAPEPGEENGLGDAGGKGSGAGRLAGAAAAVPAAGAIGQIMLLAMFLNWLKGMAMAFAAILTNLANLIIGLVLAAAKVVVGLVMGIGGAVAGAVGGAVSAAVAGTVSVVSGLLIGALVIVGAVVGVNTSNQAARKDGLIDCSAAATVALASVSGSDTNVDAQTLANAKTIYGVFSAWGMPAENIAAIIGNWDAESGIDPTSVQGDFSSPQQMTDAKKSAATTLDNGIGLGQWTAGRNEKLRDYATGHGKDWWTLEAQLGFMISAAEGSDAAIVKDMMVTPYGTPAEAAIHFHDKWERSADTPSMAARRGEKATKWMGMFAGWTKDTALADSILAQAGTTVGGANSSRAQAVRADCRGVGGATLTMAEGGLTLDQATQVMALYKSEGEQFLVSRYAAGGPGDCGFGKADNCVGFSTYFVNKYTSFQQYAPGNGIDTAGSMAKMMGKTLTKVPKAYSVGSGPGAGPEGHTMVVLGIQGGNAVVGEANCGTNGAGTKALLMPLSELTNGSWNFVDVTDIMTTQPSKS